MGDVFYIQAVLNRQITPCWQNDPKQRMSALYGLMEPYGSGHDGFGPHGFGRKDPGAKIVEPTAHTTDLGVVRRPGVKVYVRIQVRIDQDPPSRTTWGPVGSGAQAWAPVEFERGEPMLCSCASTDVRTYVARRDLVTMHPPPKVCSPMDGHPPSECTSRQWRSPWLRTYVAWPPGISASKGDR